MTKRIEKFLWLSKEKKVISCDETNKVLNENIILDNYLDIDLNSEQNNYYSFVEKRELKDLFTDLIFKNN